MDFIRHGDRNFRNLKELGLEIPKNLKPRNDKVVGVGESNHRHKITGQALVYDLEEPQNVKYNGKSYIVDQFVDVLEDTTIIHEEHHERPILKGQYALLPEQEVDVLEQKIRSVMD